MSFDLANLTKIEILWNQLCGYVFVAKCVPFEKMFEYIRYNSTK